MNSSFNRKFAADIAAKLPSHRRIFATTIIQSRYRGHLVPTMYHPKPKRPNGGTTWNRHFMDKGLLRSVPDGCISVQGEWYDRRIDWKQVTVPRGPLEAQLDKQVASRRIKKRRKIDALHEETAILGLVSKIAAKKVNEDIKKVTALSRMDAEERVVDFAKMWRDSGIELWALDDHGNFTPFNCARLMKLRSVLTASTLPTKDQYGEVMVTLHNPRETRGWYTGASMTAHAMLRGSATQEAPHLVKVRSKFWGYQMLRHGYSWHSSPQVANSGVYVEWYRPYGEVRNDPSDYATYASRRGEVVTSLVFTPTALAVLRRAVLAKLRFVSKHALDWFCEKISDPMPIVLGFLLSARTIQFRGEYVQ